MSDENMRKYHAMFKQMMASMQCDVSLVASGQSQLTLPKYEGDDLIELCKDVKQIFLKEQTVLDISTPVTIVGDLHGQILDLFRIIQANGVPLSRKYLFLGDFVDRGEFSLEVVTCVFLMKMIFPRNVFIIRGNHEFECVCATGGFGSEIQSMYRNYIVFYAFSDAFSAIPLGALIDRSMLAVHGGIGPDFKLIDQLRSISRPIPDFDDGVLDSILWSDPNPDISTFEQSKRGTGWTFGAQALRSFIELNAIKCVIRGHQCVGDGYLELFDKRLITIFSASNYCGSAGNKGGMMSIKQTGEIVYQQFVPLPPFSRSMVHFPGAEPEKKPPLKRPMGANSMPQLSTDQNILPVPVPTGPTHVKPMRGIRHTVDSPKFPSVQRDGGNQQQQGNQRGKKSALPAIQRRCGRNRV